ncbi:hypothetical protein C0J52_12414 [Blattella germanica]|nr:hypothetical protein C0J52_12414 [Blattella germanica]
MASAILALSPDNLVIATFPSLKKSSRFIHAVLQGIGLISIIVGFATIIVYKNENGSNHFVSYHAITGLVTVICSFLTCAGGLLTYFAVNLKDIIKPSYNKIGHGIFGIFTFSLGIAAEGTGFFTSAFEGVVDSNEGVQIACGLFTYYAVKLKDFVKPSYNKIGHAIIGILTFALGIVAEGTGIFTKPFQFRSNSEVQIACTVLMSLASLIVLEVLVFDGRSNYTSVEAQYFQSTALQSTTVDTTTLDSQPNWSRLCDNWIDNHCYA